MARIAASGSGGGDEIRVSSLSDKIGELYGAALALVDPQACAVCVEECVESSVDAPACAKCWRVTRVFEGDETLCRKCGALAYAGLPAEKRGGVRCRRCDAWEFVAARACGPYAGALRASVLS